MPHNYQPDAYPGGPLPGTPGSPHPPDTGGPIPPDPPIDPGPPIDPPIDPGPPPPIEVDFRITSESMVNPPPTMPIMTVYFHDETIAAAGIAEWAWEFPGGGDSISSIEQNPVVQYIATGTSFVRLTVRDNNNNVASLTLGIDIPVLPDHDQVYYDRATLIRDWITADFNITSASTINPPPFQPIMNVWFHDASTAVGGIASWHWLIPDGIPNVEDIVPNPSTSYLRTGLFDVTLKVTGNDGSTNTLRARLDVPVLDDHDEIYYDRVRMLKLPRAQSGGGTSGF